MVATLCALAAVEAHRVNRQPLQSPRVGHTRRRSSLLFSVPQKLQSNFLVFALRMSLSWFVQVDPRLPVSPSPVVSVFGRFGSGSERSCIEVQSVFKQVVLTVRLKPSVPSKWIQLCPQEDSDTNVFSLALECNWHCLMANFASPGRSLIISRSVPGGNRCSDLFRHCLL